MRRRFFFWPLFDPTDLRIGFGWNLYRNYEGGASCFLVYLHVPMLSAEFRWEWTS